MMRPHDKRWFQYGILSWDNNINPQFYGTGGKSKQRLSFRHENFQLCLRESLLSASGLRRSRREKSVVLITFCVNKTVITLTMLSGLLIRDVICNLIRDVACFYL